MLLSISLCSEIQHHIHAIGYILCEVLSQTHCNSESSSEIAWELRLHPKCSIDGGFFPPFPGELGKEEMCIRLVCILHRLDDSGPDRQELSSSEVPLRAREKEMHMRSSKEGWTSHSPNLYSGSVCRSAEAPATGPGTNSITDSWLAGEHAASLGKWGKKVPFVLKER